jgi:hypothetical protein
MSGFELVNTSHTDHREVSKGLCLLCHFAAGTPAAAAALTLLLKSNARSGLRVAVPRHC